MKKKPGQTLYSSIQLLWHRALPELSVNNKNNNIGIIIIYFIIVIIILFNKIQIFKLIFLKYKKKWKNIDKKNIFIIIIKKNRQNILKCMLTDGLIMSCCGIVGLVVL